MVNRPCWYIMKDGSVVGIADAPVNTEDLNRNGFEVIESDHYEPDIQKIKTIVDGIPVLKNIIYIGASKNPDGTMYIKAFSDNYQGAITVFIYNRPFVLTIGEALTIVPLEGYPLNLTVNPDSNFYVEIGGGL